MDLPVAFLHALNDEKVMMFIKGKLADLMFHVTPNKSQQPKLVKNLLHEGAKSTLWNVEGCTFVQ